MGRLWGRWPVAHRMRGVMQIEAMVRSEWRIGGVAWQGLRGLGARRAAVADRRAVSECDCADFAGRGKRKCRLCGVCSGVRPRAVVVACSSRYARVRLKRRCVRDRSWLPKEQHNAGRCSATAERGRASRRMCARGDGRVGCGQRLWFWQLGREQHRRGAQHLLQQRAGVEANRWP